MDNLKNGIEQYTRMIQDAYKNQDRVGKVALTTIHSSKGLEYQRVIIFDVNEVKSSISEGLMKKLILKKNED